VPMKNSFTLNDLILFNQFENEFWKEEHSVKSEYHGKKPGYEFTKFTEISDNFRDNLFSPEKRIISNIMDYSRALFVINTKKAGYFTVLMN
jgi:hypothetical protein